DKTDTSASTQEKTVNTGEYKSVSEETVSKQFKSITSDEAKEMISDGKVFILDVRSQEGFSESHLANAQNIPLKELEAKISELDKNETYLIVCKTGKTSEMASTLLAENGYKNIFNLSGGMDTWNGEVVDSK
ncbi:MAG: rhodanese-like domain-containing protein, partial [Bacillus sp. (in: Bacteria)]|nr:rhodanese-like domain-containing protein [Bacillus sp. (in: firmicutes)]